MIWNFCLIVNFLSIILGWQYVESDICRLQKIHVLYEPNVMFCISNLFSTHKYNILCFWRAAFTAGI